MCRIACIQFNTHLPQCTPSTDTSHMAQLALCACVGHGAANVVFLDRHGIGPGLGFFPRSLLRVPPETGPGLVSLSSFIGTLCATCTLVPCTLSSIHAHHVNCNCVLSPYVNCNSRVTEGNFPRAIIISFGTVFSTDR